MLKNKFFICFGEDWGRHPSSTQHIIKVFAKENRVLWINSISYRSPQFNLGDLARLFNKFRNWFTQPQQKNLKNLYVYSPIAFPFFQNAFFRKVNKYLLKAQVGRLIRKLKIDSPILWISVPTARDMLKVVDNELAIYYCGDEFSQLPGLDYAAIGKLEDELLREVDLVIVSSAKLEETKRKINPNTFLVTHGVEFRHFNDAMNKKNDITEDFKNIPHPTIGFYGILAEWVDIDLIEFLAREKPQWSFVLIGSAAIDISKLKFLKNVYFLGPRSYKELPACAKIFDVAIIPFKVNELTASVFPLKFFEYFAMGLPVVTTNLPDLAVYQPLCRLANTKEDFLKAVSEYIEEDSEEFKRRRMGIARNESWDKKVEEVSKLIEEKIKKRNKNE